MTKKLRHLAAAFMAVAMLTAISGCETVDDDRLPPFTVFINLGNTGVWNTYGVNGFGIWRVFNRETREPGDFPFTDRTYTGFGGVLLIGGMDPFTGDTFTPLAYDLSCPVECKSDIRVAIDPSTLEAVCPVCESHYDVTMAGGSPLSGPAVGLKYAMRRYKCLPSDLGGFIVTR